MMESQLIFGCVADDFTGASDAASFLVAGGANTVLVNGIPNSEFIFPDGTAAVVIALKSRTEDTKQAVTDSICALDWLKERGAKQLYIKYCSTFDSTRRGNIGPICDAAMQAWNTQYTLLCPSLPINGRTVKSGHLFVNGMPLHQTHMQNHPLTPMWDSFIPNLMSEQSTYPCIVVEREQLNSGDIKGVIAYCCQRYEHFYLVPDYEDEHDASVIAEHFGDFPLLTGGSGLMLELGKKISGHIQQKPFPLSKGERKTILLAGSCSEATRGQVNQYLNGGGKGIMLSPAKLLDGTQTVNTVWEEIAAEKARQILIYSAGSAGIHEPVSSLNDAAQTLESMLSLIVLKAYENEFTHIIVAGGETSGAVTKALGFSAYFIGGSVAPGVPVMVPLSAPDVRLVLKSGNFGQPSFFEEAIKMMEG